MTTTPTEMSGSEPLRVIDNWLHDIGLCQANPVAGLASSTANLGARVLFARGGAGRAMGAAAAAIGAASLVRDCHHPEVVAIRPAGRSGTAYAIPAEWGLSQLTKAEALDLLGARLRAASVTVRHTASDRAAGVIWIVVQIVDPLDRLIGGRVPPPAPVDLSSILLGMNEHGRPAMIPLKDRNGMVYTALSGGGKTFTLNAMLAGWAQHEAVQLVIIDGKAGADYVPWEPRAQVYLPTTDRQAVVDALEPYRGELARRTALYRANLVAWRDVGAPKGLEPATSFWHQLPTPELPLIVIVVDEIQALTSGAATKEEKAAQAALTSLLTDLMGRGRSAGIVTIAAMQKSTSTEIPTVIRDKAAMRLAGRLKTSDDVRAALGGSPGEGEPNPMDLPDRPGMVVLASEEGEIVRARSWYVEPGDLVRLGLSVAELRRPLPTPTEIDDEDGVDE